MKRTNRKLSLVLVALCACAIAAALSGCEALGIGNTGNGIPQVGQAKVAAPTISEEGVLRVGVDAANAPFSTLIDGKMVGIDVDIAAALGDELGVKVKVVDVGANPEEALDKGTVDVVLGMDASDTAATCWLSDPYLSTAVAIFATSSGAIMPTAASKPVIEAQESSMSAWEITNQFGEEALKTAPDLRTVFEDLESGNTTYAAADAIIGSYVAHTSGGKAQIIGLMQKPGGYCVGVAAANNDLKPIIADAVKALRESGVIGVVASKWLGSSINMSALALTEAAAKGDALAAEEDKGEEASSSSEPKESSIGAVGGNAVNLQDDGTQPGQTTTDAGATTDTYWGYTYDTTDYGNTYTEPEAAYTEQTDGGAAYTEDAGVQDAGDAGYVDGGGTDAAAEGGEAPAGAEGEAA